VTDGLFDCDGNFHPVLGINSDQATILFREKVFAMMKGNGRINDASLQRLSH